MVLEKLNFLVEGITQDIIVYLIEDYNMSKEKAMEILYNSETYDKLCNLETHLYYESSSYVYEILKEEINKKN